MDLMSVFRWVASLPGVNGDFLDSDVFGEAFTAVLEELPTIQSIYHSTPMQARPLLANGILTLGDRPVNAGGWVVARVTDTDYSGVQFRRDNTVYELEATEVEQLYRLLIT